MYPLWSGGGIGCGPKADIHLGLRVLFGRWDLWVLFWVPCGFWEEPSRLGLGFLVEGERDEVPAGCAHVPLLGNGGFSRTGVGNRSSRTSFYTIHHNKII